MPRLIVANRDVAELSGLLDDEEFFSRSRLIKSGGATQVGCHDERMLWKRYRRKSNFFSAFLQEKKLSQQFFIAAELTATIGWATPANIALYKLPEGDLLLFSEYFPWKNLGDYHQHIQALGDHDRRALLSRMAGFVYAVHGAGYSHGDMKWANILVAENLADFLLIDLDNLSRVSADVSRKKMKDVARFCRDSYRLGLSPRDVDIFLQEYARLSSIPYQDLLRRAEPFERKLAARHAKKN